MENPLDYKDFKEFDELYKELRQKIIEKKADEEPLSDDLVQTFQELSNKIDSLLARVGRRKSVIA